MRPIVSSAVVLALGLAASAALAASSTSTPEQTRDAKPRAGETLHIDKDFSILLDNQCRYNARVRGEITRTNSTSSEAELLVPNLVINADLQCANEATLLMPQRVRSTQPLTWEELSRTIEDRAELTSPEGRYSCVYAPDVNLSDAGLNLRAVNYRCPVA
jgi:hypothetical protein